MLEGELPAFLWFLLSMPEFFSFNFFPESPSEKTLKFKWYLCPFIIWIKIFDSYLNLLYSFLFYFSWWSEYNSLQLFLEFRIYFSQEIVWYSNQSKTMLYLISCVNCKGCVLWIFYLVFIVKFKTNTFQFFSKQVDLS